MTGLDLKSQGTLSGVGWVLHDGRCGFCFRCVHRSIYLRADDPRNIAKVGE
jgi:hypothetical protein